MRTSRMISQSLRLLFDYSGGEYIEVREPNRIPVEVINVWDYKNDKASIPFLKKALNETVDEWIRGYPKDYLVFDVRQNWKWSY